MKKYIFVGMIVVVIGIIFIGNYSWNEKVEQTVEKAEETIKNPPKASAKVNDTDSTNDDSDSSETTIKGSTQQQQGTNSSKSGTTASNTESSEGVTAEDSEEDSEEDSSEDSDKNVKKSVEEIKEYYYALFQELEAQETSKVDQLIVEAKAEYISHKGTKTEIISKYQGVASLMEQNADSAFNIIYQQLQYDLEYNGHSLNEAQEFQQSYNAKKQARLSRVLSQIKDF